MKPRPSRRLVAAGLVCLIASLSVPHVRVLLSFPDQFRVVPGQRLQLDVGPLFRIAEIPLEIGEAAPRGSDAQGERSQASPGAVPEVVPGGEAQRGDDPGDEGVSAGNVADGNMAKAAGEFLADYGLELRLLGVLPVQRAKVSVVPRVEVIPSGQAVGILLSQRGLIVVRTVPVMTRAGVQASPARDAGVLPGDILVSAGGSPIEHPLDLQDLVDAYGRNNRPLELLLLRRGREVRVEVLPVPREGTGPGGAGYALGLQLKDPAAGVGTLTFWEPSGRAYGALGHMIAEGGDALALGDGRIVPAVIHGVLPGMRGRPGEKIGLFDNSAPLGNIEKNTDFGIFGRLLPEAADRLAALGQRPVPVALAHEVHTGQAEILTVVDGSDVRSYEVEIVHVERQSRPTAKGLVIEVTDPELLARTGGIVQGMSGSPILQDGKLVGAVTHVFINNPRRGFGVLAEWMIYEAGIADPAAAAPEGLDLAA